MSIVVNTFIGGLLVTALAAGAQPVAPASAPASAPVPATAASRAMPARSPAVVAAENAKEPGVQRPEERVIPQVSIPLKSRKSVVPAASTASATMPGGVNEAAARCRAAADRGACERGLAASEASKR